MRTLLLLGCLVASSVTAFATPHAEVDVVVDMTPLGRKSVHPDPAHPAYYFPVVGGWKEMGAIVAGEKAPSPHEVVRVAAVELAKQGYLVVDQAHPKPSIVLSLFWGSLNPEIDDPNAPTGTMDNPFYNQNQMLALVGGNTLENLDLFSEREQVMQAAKDDRYFVIISAFDFETFERTHKKAVLWRAKLSVPRNGVRFDDVLTVLLKAGGPLFGRETKVPKMLVLPITPEGTVTIGDPKVVDFRDAPARRPDAKKK